MSAVDINSPMSPSGLKASLQVDGLVASMNGSSLSSSLTSSASEAARSSSRSCKPYTWIYAHPLLTKRKLPSLLVP